MGGPFPGPSSPFGPCRRSPENTGKICTRQALASPPGDFFFPLGLPHFQVRVLGGDKPQGEVGMTAAYERLLRRGTVTAQVNVLVSRQLGESIEGRSMRGEALGQ